MLLITTKTMGEKFELVYCCGTAEGKGVIEALEAHGGINVDNFYHGCLPNHLYYIGVGNRIKSCVDGGEIAELITALYTQIPPLE